MTFGVKINEGNGSPSKVRVLEVTDTDFHLTKGLFHRWWRLRSQGTDWASDSGGGHLIVSFLVETRISLPTKYSDDFFVPQFSYGNPNFLFLL